MKTPVLIKKVISILFLTLALMACQNRSGEQTSSENNLNPDPTEWVDLLSNGDVSQWRGDNSESFPEAGWKVEGNVLVVNAPSEDEPVSAGNLFTKQAYGNFEFYWEWKMLTMGGNSGVKYFVPGGDHSYATYGPGPEYQILDDANHPWMLEGKMKPFDHYTMGSCYELYAADSSKSPAPLGEWNTSRIVSKDGHVEHWLNGDKIVEYNRFSDDFATRVLKSKFKEFPKYGLLEKGHIMLQDHGGEIYFRNMKIKVSDP